MFPARPFRSSSIDGIFEYYDRIVISFAIKTGVLTMKALKYHTQNTDQLQLTLSYFPALISSQSSAQNGASVKSVPYFHLSSGKTPVVINDLCWVVKKRCTVIRDHNH